MGRLGCSRSKLFAIEDLVDPIAPPQFSCYRMSTPCSYDHNCIDRLEIDTVDTESSKACTNRKQRHLSNAAFYRIWWRRLDLNQRPSGYEPDELPGCSTPRRFLPQPT
jgi:hypothetical protein